MFYITGRGGSLHSGLCAYLFDRYGLVGGLNLSSSWLSHPHEEQIAQVTDCLADAEASGEPVIANSYGAYLLMLRC